MRPAVSLVCEPAPTSRWLIMSDARQWGRVSEGVSVRQKEIEEVPLNARQPSSVDGPVQADSLVTETGASREELER